MDVELKPLLNQMMTKKDKSGPARVQSCMQNPQVTRQGRMTRAEGSIYFIKFFILVIMVMLNNKRCTIYSGYMVQYIR